MTKYFIGLFLVLHGLVHAAYFGGPNDPKYPFLAKNSWLVTKMGMAVETFKPIMITLAVIALVGFFLAGLSHLGWLVPQGWFKWLVVASSVVSLLLMAVTWSNNFVVGAGIDVVLLYLVIAGILK